MVPKRLPQEGRVMAEITLQEYVQQLEGMVEQGHYDELLAHGRHILEHYPKHLATYAVMGKGLFEAGQQEMAEDMFRRVLSGDPEDPLIHAGLSAIYEQRGDLQKALWYLERAFELAPDNGVIRNELRRLYGRIDGVEPGRLDLTPGALARLYARGALYSRAIEEFRALLAEDDQRVDLMVALAEALWRNGQTVQAEEACLEVLERLPYCLKANLLLGEIYTRTGRAEARECLQRAQALDPTNEVAAALLEEASPLAPRTVRLPRLDYRPPEERPAWMPSAIPTAVEESSLLDISSALETQIELPSWLREITLGEEQPSGEEAGEGEEEAAPGEELEVPPWLLEQPGAAPEPPPPQPVEEVPDWLREAIPEEREEETLPPQPSPFISEAAEEAFTAEEATPIPAEIPDWLREIAPPAEMEGTFAAAPTAEPEEEALPAEEAAPIPAEIPDWLREIAPPEMEIPATPFAAELEETLPAAPAPAPEAEGPTLPAWLEGEGMPSGDEALAWLESLAAGKEEELRAAAEAEGEARAAEITGRPFERPTPPPQPPEWLTETLPGAPAPAAEEAPPAAEGAAVPAWLEGEGMPSGDEALAWLESLAAGKEEELRAAAEAEGEARAAEITGRPFERPAPPPPVEAPPPIEEPALELPEWLSEPVSPAEAAAPSEEPSVPPWLASLMAEEEGEAGAPAVEAAPPEWLVETPPEAPAPQVVEPAPATVEPLPEVPGRLEEPLPTEAAPFGWTTIGEEAAPAEAAIPPAPTPEEGFGWTGFAAPEAPPAVPAEEVPAAAWAPPTAPPQPVEPPAPPAAEVVRPPRPHLARVDELERQVQANRKDYETRLTLARELWQAGLAAEAIEHYSALLRANRLVAEVVEDAQSLARQRRHDPMVKRLLGDAYVRVGRLAEALEAYREALENL
jgi:tetratricopeptide (TPR) repeat protein